MFIIYLFVFLFGLIIGSFLNVVIFRLESGEQMVSGRSHCRHCDRTLEWYDLIPIFSFLSLMGKCRYCRKKLSLQYPLVEMVTAVLFVLSLRATVGSEAIPCLISSVRDCFVAPLLAMTMVNFFYYFFIISSLIVIFVYDLKHYIIPDKVVYSAIVISVIYLIFGQILGDGRILEIGLPCSGFGSPTSDLLFGNLTILFSPIFAAIAAGAFFLAIVLITKGEGMGGGDVKLAFLMGLVLGWPKILVALFLAFTLGAICGIIFVIAKKKSLKSAIPFGPFLVIGTLLALFWGEEIVKWYGGFLF